MAIMPHPERCDAGQLIFSSMKRYIENKPPVDLSPFSYNAPKQVSKSFLFPDTGLSRLVQLIIEDNAAKTLALALSE